MGKSLFYNADVWKHPFEMLSYCGFCKKHITLPHEAEFRYYDMSGMKIVNYIFMLCYDCFKERIDQKPLDELKYIVPLLKMMKGNLVEKNTIYVTLEQFYKKFTDEYSEKFMDAQSEKKKFIFRVFIPEEEKQIYLNNKDNWLLFKGNVLKIITMDEKDSDG